MSSVDIWIVMEGKPLLERMDWGAGEGMARCAPTNKMKRKSRMEKKRKRKSRRGSLSFIGVE